MIEKEKWVLDTNVVISGMLSTTSPPHKILKRCFTEKKLVPVVSDDILKEYERKLNSMEAIDDSDAEFTMKLMIAHAEKVSPRKSLRVVKEDPDDNMLFEAALEADADFIVSGDKEVLKVGKYKGISVITPSEAEKRRSRN